MHWQSALEQVLEIIYTPLDHDRVRWAVIGSVASVLQGCQISPNDIDILAFNPQGVYCVAELMAGYAPPTCEYPLGDIEWRSSEALPVSAGPDEYGFTWHFARWFVDDFRVEVAHIVAPEGFPTSNDGAGIWEAGPEIWPFIRTQPFAGYQLPVVPLEIQLETNLSRGLENRVGEIVAVFQENGYDCALIQKSLAKRHLKVLEGLMQEQ